MHLSIETTTIIIETLICSSHGILHLNKNRHTLHHLSPFPISKNSPHNSSGLKLLFQDLTTRSAIWLLNLMMSTHASFHLKKTWILTIAQTPTFGTKILIAQLWTRMQPLTFLDLKTIWMIGTAWIKIRS